MIFHTYTSSLCLRPHPVGWVGGGGGVTRHKTGYVPVSKKRRKLGFSEINALDVFPENRGNKNIKSIWYHTRH